MNKKWLVGFFTIVTLIVISGCNVFSGGSEESSIHVARDDAKELEVELNLGAGKLTVQEGANDWVEGSIYYNKKKLEPEVSYKLSGDKGKVVIEQSENDLVDLNFGDVKNEWDLLLSDEIPMDLVINSGATDSELYLNGLQLLNLDVNAGVGDLKIDLTGDWKESVDVDLESGVGEVNVILPENVGVKVVSSNGLGKASFDGFTSAGNGVYVNDAYADAEVVITVDAEMGVGEVDFTLK